MSNIRVNISNSAGGGTTGGGTTGGGTSGGGTTGGGTTGGGIIGGGANGNNTNGSTSGILGDATNGIAVPNTGSNFNTEANIGGFFMTPWFIVSIVLGCLAIWFIKFRRRQAKSFVITHHKATLASVVAIFTAIGLFAAVSDFQDQQVMPAEAAGLSVSVQDVNLDVVRSSENTFATARSNITVNDSTNNGYILTVYADKADIINEQDSSAKIGALSSATKTKLGTNTWGIALNQSSIPTNSDVWQTMPTSTAPLTIKNTTSATVPNDTTTVYYGVNVNKELPEGSYVNTIVYQAVANVAASQANLDTGGTINVKMKNLANNITNATVDTVDTKITNIAQASYLPFGFVPSEANTISLASSPAPVYIFFEGSTMYYYTGATNIYMNSDSSNMMNSLSSLSNINALASWISNNVTNMSYMFNKTKINFVGPLESWNMSNVTHMDYMFANSSINGIDNISHSTFVGTLKPVSLKGIFAGTSGTDFNFSGWNLNMVADASYMFDGARAQGITNLVLNSGSLKNTAYMFRGYNFTPLDSMNFGNWNVNNVENMQGMFYDASLWSGTLDGIDRWNPVRVTDTSYMFYGCQLETSEVSLMKNWRLSSVTNMQYMFYDTHAQDYSSLDGWFVSGVELKAKGIVADNAFNAAYNHLPTWYIEYINL